MTHDPREALEPCPFCGGEAERVDVPTDLGGDPNAGGSCIQCKRCTASTALHFDRKENLYSSWNDRCGRALTASPGEQKPPPAAVWNEAIEAAINIVKPWPGAEGLAQSEPEKAVENIRREFVKALKALRRAAPAPEGVAGEPTLAIRLEARPTNGSADWTEIFPAQLNWVAKAGHEVRAIEAPSRPDAGGGVREALDDMIGAFAEGVCWSAEQRAAYEKAVKALSTPPAAVERDCEVCGGDCASANPPVAYCPVNERKQRKEALSRAREMLKVGIDIQATGEATNAVVTGLIKSLLDHIDDLDADLKCAIAVGRMAARPAAVESNASVEARLRELLCTIRSMHGELGAKFDDISKYMPNDHAAQAAARSRQKGLGLAIEPIERTLKALSSGGDEAKKSEGGLKQQARNPAGLPDSSGDLASAGVIARDDIKDHRRQVGSNSPSDPTAERREIVARIINPEVFAKYDAELAKDRRAENGKRWADVCYGEAICRALAKADAILAALDGGAGA